MWYIVWKRSVYCLKIYLPGIRTTSIYRHIIVDANQNVQGGVLGLLVTPLLGLIGCLRGPGPPVGDSRVLKPLETSQITPPRKILATPLPN